MDEHNMGYTSTKALYLLSSLEVMWRASEWKGESSPTKISVRHCNFLNPPVMSYLLHTSSHHQAVQMTNIRNKNYRWLSTRKRKLRA